MIAIQNGLDAESIYDLVKIVIHGRYAAKKPSDEQVRKYKRCGSEWIKDDKYLYAHEHIITPKQCKVSTSKAIEFRSKLGFKQYDIVLNKEQSVTKIMKTLSNGKTLLQYFVWSYRIELYFPEHKSATEIDGKGHEDRILTIK